MAVTEAAVPEAAAVLATVADTISVKDYSAATRTAAALVAAHVAATSTAAAALVAAAHCCQRGGLLLSVSSNSHLVRK